MTIGQGDVIAFTLRQDATEDELEQGMKRPVHIAGLLAYIGLNDTALPAGGTVNQIIKNTAPGEGEWDDEVTGLPAGGSIGQIIKNTAPGDGTWQDEGIGLTDKISWYISLSGSTAAQFKLVGEHRVIASGQVADYATDFSVGNQHASVVVNSITTGGTIIITGVAVSESTAVPVATTENIVVDTSADQHYQTTNKWLEITNIDVSGTTNINYDIEVVGYLDMGNRDFTITGIRAEFRSGGSNADIAVRIRKVQDDGSGKMALAR